MPEHPPSWERIEAALDSLITCAPGARQALLATLGAGDEALGRELRSLLAAHDASGGFLEHGATEFSAPFLVELDDGGEHAGLIVGRYRLVERIGSGGMGTVWLAERADGHFEHRVAIKLVKRGMDTDEVIARFRRERQILARLDHPSIARLVDGGVTSDGRPFLVMDHVDGVPITDHCEQHTLSVTERLALFEHVCRAVHHAHQNLVVHRDIKPSNVMVARTGEVKLLDFGIAKLLSADPLRETRTGWHRPLTIHYASPEQVTGEAITTASDIYQLGLLLYELLTGQRAVTVHGTDLAAVHRAVCERPVPRPSTMLSGTPHGQLRGNLDAVAATALQKEPARRYASAHAMAEDLRRHRLGLPISARGVGAWHRAQGIARRHRNPIAAAVAATAAIVTTATLYTTSLRSERDVALLEGEKGRQSAEFVRRFLEGWNPVAADSTQVNVSYLLGEAHRRTNAELHEQPIARAAMLSLLGELYTGTRQYHIADSLLTEAIAVQHTSTSTRADLAVSLSRRGAMLMSLNRFAESDSVLSRALALHETVLGVRHVETGRARRHLARLRGAQGRWLEADTLYRAVLDGLRSGATDVPRSLFETEVLSELGYALFEQAKYDEAEAMLEQSLRRQRELVGTVHSSLILTLRALASTHRDQGNFARAEQLYREATRVAEALYGKEHPQTDVTRFVLTLHLHRSMKLREAEQLSREGIALISRDQVNPDPMSANWHKVLGMVLLDDGRDLEAVAPLQRSLDALRRVHPDGHDEEVDLLNRLAYIAARHGHSAARGLYDEARRVRDRRQRNAPDHLTDGIHFLAWTMAHMGDEADARVLYTTAANLYMRSLPAEHPYTHFVRTAGRRVRPQSVTPARSERL